MLVESFFVIGLLKKNDNWSIYQFKFDFLP